MKMKGKEERAEERKNVEVREAMGEEGVGERWRKQIEKREGRVQGRK